MEELAGRPEAGAALEVAALLGAWAWAGARASEAEVRGAHVPIGGGAAHACGWRSACLCACGQRRDAHHRAAIGGRKHVAVGRPGGPGERARSMPRGAAPATPTTERRVQGAKFNGRTLLTRSVMGGRSPIAARMYMQSRLPSPRILDLARALGAGAEAPRAPCTSAC